MQAGDYVGDAGPQPAAAATAAMVPLQQWFQKAGHSGQCAHAHEFACLTAGCAVRCGGWHKGSKPLLNGCWEGVARAAEPKGAAAILVPPLPAACASRQGAGGQTPQVLRGQMLAGAPLIGACCSIGGCWQQLRAHGGLIQP
jgi:hypothetical protein